MPFLKNLESLTLSTARKICRRTVESLILELMNTGTPPTAVFSTNHDITMGVVTAAREQGLRIPEDVEIFGYDSVNICAVMTPPLPVVYQPEQEIGRTAAAYLIERLEGYAGASRKTRLPCEMIL